MGRADERPQPHGPEALGTHTPLATGTRGYNPQNLTHKTTEQMGKNKLILILLGGLLGSCSEFLDERPTASILVPETAQDLRSLLNNSGQVFNMTPALGEVSAGEYFTTDAALNGFSAIERNSYSWADEIFEGLPSSDWNRPYSQILYANVVLEQAEKLHATIPMEEYNALTGSALFHRAFALFHLVQVFAPPFEPGKEEEILGLPMRTSATIQQPVFRPTLGQNYKQMLEDLEKAVSLLPENTDAKTFPTVFAAHALLSKIFLVQGNYQKALEQTVKVLPGNYSLMDYNEINPVPLRPFTNFNSEMIFYAVMPTLAFTINANIFIDPGLISLYSDTDLRKSLYYRQLPSGNFGFRGSYIGNAFLFSGLALDEVYLTKAECEARLGMFDGARETMRELLEKRHLEGTDLNLGEIPVGEILSFVLMERRKQLVFRAERWSDLKRLNRESEFRTTLKRTVNGQELILEPESLKYALPIPPNEIELSGIEQNPR